MRWGTIKDTDPLTIKPDGSTAAVPVDVNVIGATPLLGDRLPWMMIGRQLVLLGDPRPVAEVMMSSGKNVPPNSFWMFADGSELVRADYSELDAIYSSLGYPWGAGDGTTTFNILQMHGAPTRFPKAAGGRTYGGAAQHQHNLSDAGQAQIGILATGGAVFFRDATTASYTEDQRMTGTSGSAGSGQIRGTALRGTTDNTPGDGSAYPPNAGLAFFVKVK
jgi:microcystin-dependent protein